MATSPYSEEACVLCGDPCADFGEDDSQLCTQCRAHAEDLFEEEMRKVELLRTIRGRDVELYDIKHPDAAVEKEPLWPGHTDQGRPRI